MGIEIDAVQINTPKLEGETLFWNIGFKAQSLFNENWRIDLAVHHSIRNFEEERGGLRFPTDLPNGPTSNYFSQVTEKLVELEHQIQYQFLKS